MSTERRLGRLAIPVALALTVTLPAVDAGLKAGPSDQVAPLDGVWDAVASVEGLRPPLHPHHQMSLALTADLLAIREADYEDRFAYAIAVAKRATQGQAEMLGYGWNIPVPLKGYRLPSEGLRELAARNGAGTSAALDSALEVLDALPSGIRTAMARFVDAFLAFDTAGRLDIAPDLLTSLAQDIEAPQDAWVSLLPARPGAEPTIAEDLRALGLDLSRVFPTRAQFLDTISDLRAAFLANPEPTPRDCAPIQVPPLFSFELSGCNTTYPYTGFILALDVGGNDWHHTNAGGSNVYLSPSCGIQTPLRAALVDLGRGSDAFGGISLCGLLGGGHLGSGFLLDDGGDDLYAEGSSAAKGGGRLLGTGFQLDVDGNDIYEPLDAPGYGGRALNGAGYDGGIGMLLDTGGSDTYSSAHTSNGAAGGFGRLRGAGFLLDTDGHDIYLTRSGSNGAGYYGGRGYLADLGGNDLYIGGDLSNGGGNDIVAGLSSPRAGVASAGFLFDAEGDDTYLAGGNGSNGGGTFAGRGMLVDLQGHDSYEATQQGTNGGGVLGGQGFLIDLGGNDRYEATWGGTNGGASGAGIGTLLDRAGDDTYTAEEGGNGGASDFDFAFLGVTLPGGFGLLLDFAGEDQYSDPLVACKDCSLAPKGTVGAQLDSDDPAPT